MTTGHYYNSPFGGGRPDSSRAQGEDRSLATLVKMKGENRIDSP